jgi:hypothetical protein
MKKIKPENGKYIWCYVDGDSISPEGNGKSLDYAKSIKHNQRKNWKLFRLVNACKINEDFIEKQLRKATLDIEKIGYYLTPKGIVSIVVNLIEEQLNK